MDQKEQVQPKQNIILDSNVIQYAADKSSTVVVSVYLSELLVRGFGLAISDITIFELLKGANVKNETEMLQVLNLFQRYYLTDNVLIASAQLETLYKIDGLEPKQIESGDKFIAATSILTGSLILTANSRDFPSPCFQESERKPIIFEEKRKRSKCILFTILTPDIAMINQRFGERTQR